jgi:cyclohexanecarboxylate-CoA ligase
MLRATFHHTRASWYLRPGGPWDVGTLDAALSKTAAPAIGDGRQLSAVEVEDTVGRVAGGLQRRGVGHGSVVAWQRPNGWQTHVLCRACWRLGAVAAPIHHAAAAAEVAAVLEQMPDPVVIDGGLPEGDPLSPAGSPARPSDVAVVLFTAGSTGRPKAVLHTHRGLLAKAKTMVGVHGLGPADVVLMPAPMAHISGLLNGVLVPGVAGMKTVWMSRWDPTRALELISEQRVSFMIGPPTFFLGLMDCNHFTAAGVSSLRLVSSGGAGVTPAFVDRATRELDCRVKRTYGSTEAPTVTTSGCDDPPSRGRDTDGRPTGDTEVKLDAALGETGEVWVRGPELFVGYGDAELTRGAFARGGWFRTGDLGRLDEDGWLTIVGRLSDVIIRGGENIAPAEIERHLEAHPAVRQAAVVGLSDDRLGQRVCAFVVATGPFDLSVTQGWMAERGVTKFKWPERVIVLDTLPVLSAGKVDRGRLRHLAAGNS